MTVSDKFLLWGRKRKCGRRLCVPRFWSTGSTECHCGQLPGSRPYCPTHSQALGLIDGESWGTNNVLSQTYKMRTLASHMMKFSFINL